MGTPSQDTSGRLNSLHDLVLDYVNHCAYSSTARVLSQPRRKRTSTLPQSIVSSDDPGPSNNGSNGTNGAAADSMDIDGATDGPVDSSDTSSSKDREKEKLISATVLASLEKRRVILNHILNGAIIRAVEALNAHFPSVLDDSASSSTSHTGSWTPPTPPNLAARLSSTPVRAPNHASPVLPTSSHPAHVKLNLQIQSFIESFRNLAPSSPSTPSSSISSLTSSMHMSGHIPNPLHGTNGTSNGGGPGPGVTLTNALTAAQGLHAEAKKLPPDVRAIYLQEIKDVGALFAYTDPETSILKGFLDQNRRIALAEQVNLAILSSEGRRGPAFLTLIAERTSVLYALMAERGVDPRPASWTDGSAQKDLLTEHWRLYEEHWIQHGDGGLGFDLHRYVEGTW